MCVYLAPRWRRRSFVLALALSLSLLTADARPIRKLNLRQETENADSTVGDANVGVVTTTVTTRAWNASSNRNASQQSNDKLISFNNFVTVTTPSTIPKRVKLSASKGSAASTDYEATTPCARSANMNTGDPKQDDNDNDSDNEDIDGSSEDGGAENSSDSKSTNHKTTSKTGTTKKATTSVPTLPMILPPAPSAPVPPLRFDSLDHKTQKRASSNLIADEESISVDRAEVLENRTKSAFSTTTSRSLDQTLVIVSIGVVGAIASLLMFVSHKVLKKTRDGDMDLDSSIF